MSPNSGIDVFRAAARFVVFPALMIGLPLALAWLLWPTVRERAQVEQARSETGPVRIIAANCGVADILPDLVEVSRVAGIPEQARSMTGSREFWQQQGRLASFEFYRAEPILVLRPDLVIASAIQDPSTSAQIENAGVKVLRLQQFETFAGIRAAVTAIGAAVEEPQKAGAALARFDSRLEKVKQSLRGLPKPRVLGYSNYGNGYAVGVGGSQSEIFEAAGAVNAAGEISLVGAAPITFEQIVRLDPDCIAVCGENGLDCPQAKLLFAEPTLRALRAVKGRRIAVVPSRFFDALSPYVADAVEVLAPQFHPELRGPH